MLIREASYFLPLLWLVGTALGQSDPPNCPSPSCLQKANNGAALSNQYSLGQGVFAW